MYRKLKYVNFDVNYMIDRFYESCTIDDQGKESWLFFSLIILLRYWIGIW